MSNVIPSQDLCEDRSLKTTWRRKCFSEERSVVVDLYFPIVQSPFASFPVSKMTVNFSCRKTSKGVNSNGISTQIRRFHTQKSKGVSTVPKWESFMTTPESTSIVLNLTCQQYKRAVIQRLTLWCSLLALIYCKMPMTYWNNGSLRYR